MMYNGHSEHINSKKGYLVLIGGAEDKKDDKVVLKKVIGINNAKNAVVIPTASSYPTGLAEDYYYAFRELGVENISILDIREKKDTENADFIEKVNNADLIFFTGGDQFKLVNVFNDTEMLTLIRNRYNNGATIAGTSAGAAASCDPIIFDGDSAGMNKGSIHYSNGFGFIRNVTIDTHFVNRGRLGRLTQFLSSGKSMRGIGLGENTAIVVAPNNTFEVVGSEMVTVVNTEDVSFSNYDQISENDPIVINDIRVGFLQSGSVFDLNTWKVVRFNQNALSSSTFIKKVEIFCS
jgi:cyanophycinase